MDWEIAAIVLATATMVFALAHKRTRNKLWFYAQLGAIYAQLYVQKMITRANSNQGKQTPPAN